MQPLPSNNQYSLCLKVVWKEQEHSYLLASFWRNPSAWPKGNNEMMFIGEAIRRIGQANFGAEWTGSEFAAERSVFGFPSFSGTIERYWAGLRESPSGYPGPPAVQSNLAAHAPLDRASQKAAMLQRKERIEAAAVALRPAYEATVKQWNRHRQQNGPSRDRLRWVAQWIGTHGRNEGLETRLRLKDTKTRSGGYVAALLGFWETEDLIRDRIDQGYVHFHSVIASQFPDDAEPEAFYIFITRASFDRATAELIPFDQPAQFEDGLHLSPYMRAIIDAIRELKIHPYNQPDSDVLAHHFFSRWKGERPLTNNMVKKMVSVARESDSQDGAAAKNRKRRAPNPKMGDTLG